MAAGYTDNPENMSEIIPYVITNKEMISSVILSECRLYFYDTCSFRRHANLDDANAEYLFTYFKNQNSTIIITRCILMELASLSGRLNSEYIDYIRRIHEFGITILVLYEEDLFSVMDLCFSTNKVINEFLCWAVKLVKGPVSTITETLNQNERIYNEVIKEENLDNSGVYKRFFETVRANKESGDNLGEELIAVCLYILSKLPDIDHAKYHVITDDKGAALKIDKVFENLNKNYCVQDIGIFSTPKLVQILWRENILYDREHLIHILDTGTDGNIGVLGMRVHDIRRKEISLPKEEIADLIIQPNGIYISF